MLTRRNLGGDSVKVRQARAFAVLGENRNPSRLGYTHTGPPPPRQPGSGAWMVPRSEREWLIDFQMVQGRVWRLTGCWLADDELHDHGRRHRWPRPAHILVLDRTIQGELPQGLSEEQRAFLDAQRIGTTVHLRQRRPEGAASAVPKAASSASLRHASRSRPFAAGSSSSGSSSSGTAPFQETDPEMETDPELRHASTQTRRRRRKKTQDVAVQTESWGASWSGAHHTPLALDEMD